MAVLAFDEIRITFSFAVFNTLTDVDDADDTVQGNWMNSLMKSDD